MTTLHAADTSSSSQAPPESSPSANAPTTVAAASAERPAKSCGARLARRPRRVRAPRAARCRGRRACRRTGSRRARPRELRVHAGEHRDARLRVLREHDVAERLERGRSRHRRRSGSGGHLLDALEHDLARDLVPVLGLLEHVVVRVAAVHLRRDAACAAAAARRVAGASSRDVRQVGGAARKSLGHRQRSRPTNGASRPNAAHQRSDPGASSGGPITRLYVGSENPPGFRCDPAHVRDHPDQRRRATYSAETAGSAVRAPAREKTPPTPAAVSGGREERPASTSTCRRTSPCSARGRSRSRAATALHAAVSSPRASAGSGRSAGCGAGASQRVLLGGVRGA